MRLDELDSVIVSMRRGRRECRVSTVRRSMLFGISTSELDMVDDLGRASDDEEQWPSLFGTYTRFSFSERPAGLVTVRRSIHVPDASSKICANARSGRGAT